MRSARVRWLLTGADAGRVVHGQANAGPKGAAVLNATPAAAAAAAGTGTGTGTGARAGRGAGEGVLGRQAPAGVHNAHGTHGARAHAGRCGNVVVLCLATQWARSALLMREMPRAPLQALLGPRVDRLSSLCREEQAAPAHSAIAEAGAAEVSGVAGAGGGFPAGSTGHVVATTELRGGKSHVLVFRSGAPAAAAAAAAVAAAASHGDGHGALAPVVASESTHCTICDIWVAGAAHNMDMHLLGRKHRKNARAAGRT